MHIGESIVAALKPEGQTSVIHSQQVQQGGVEVVHMDGIFGDIKSEFIGLPMDMPRPYATASQPD